MPAKQHNFPNSLQWFSKNVLFLEAHFLCSYFCISRKFSCCQTAKSKNSIHSSENVSKNEDINVCICLQFQCLTSHAHHMRALIKGICTVCELSTDRGKRGRGILNKHLYLSLSTNAVSQGARQASDADWVCVCGRWDASVSLYICVREKKLFI